MLSTMNPLQIIGAANALTQLRGNQQTLAARQATGEAFQGALNDDGSIDQAKLATALRANPAAAFSLPETTDRMLSQAGSQFNLDAARSKFVVDAVGAVADDPDLNADKVRNLGVTLARNLKIPGAQINNWLDDMPKDQSRHSIEADPDAQHCHRIGGCFDANGYRAHGRGRTNHGPARAIQLQNGAWRCWYGWRRQRWWPRVCIATWTKGIAGIVRIACGCTAGHG